MKNMPVRFLCHCEHFLRRPSTSLGPSNLCVGLTLLAFPNTIIHAQELRDVKPPVSQPFELIRPNTTPLWVSLLIAALVAGGFYIYWRLKKRPPQNTPLLPPRPSWEIAFESLEHLKRENLLACGLVKEYYIRLSDIVRHYLEGRFDLRAPEMTTEEFLHSLQYSSQLNGTHKEALKNFLNACDMVKFAKHAPDLKEAEGAFLFAKRLVEETKGEAPPPLGEGRVGALNK